MAKRGRPRIHPPKIPKDEALAITVANQEKQIKLLIERCEELRLTGDHFQRLYDLERDISDRTARELNDKTLAYIRLQGFQDCARELLGTIEKPIIAPGV